MKGKLTMVMKQSNSNTQSSSAKIVDATYKTERTYQTLSYQDLKEERLLWNVKVISILQQGQRWNESLETTLTKIYDFCSSEITQYEREVLQNIQIGATDEDTSIT